MKILIVHNAYKHAGGEDTVVAQEAELLLANGHDVRLYLRSNKELDSLSTLGQLALPWRAFHGGSNLDALRDIMRTWRPDIAHIHNTFVRITPEVYRICAAFHVPVVQTLHNYRLFCPRGDFYRNGVVKTAWGKNSLGPG